MSMWHAVRTRPTCIRVGQVNAPADGTQALHDGGTPEAVLWPSRKLELIEAEEVGMLDLGKVAQQLLRLHGPSALLVHHLQLLPDLDGGLAHLGEALLKGRKALAGCLGGMKRGVDFVPMGH